MKHPRLDQRSALSAQKGHIQARTGRHVCYATWESSKTPQRSQHARIALMEALRQEWAARLANNVRLDRIASLITEHVPHAPQDHIKTRPDRTAAAFVLLGRTHSMRALSYASSVRRAREETARVKDASTASPALHRRYLRSPSARLALSAHTKR
jgi:hypothetical protein